MLFGVTWADPVSFAGALAAGYLSARRAARLAPSLALRDG
jgi:hypothetical protein